MAGENQGLHVNKLTCNFISLQTPKSEEKKKKKKKKKEKKEEDSD